MSKRVVLLGVVASTVLFCAGCDWAMVGGGPSLAGFNPETDITPQNVGTLARAWTAHVGVGVGVGDPIAAGGRVFVTVQPHPPTQPDGVLDAFDAAGATNCSGEPLVCTSLWSVTPAPGTGAAVSPPAYAAADVFVGSKYSTPLTGGTSLFAARGSDGTNVFHVSPGGTAPGVVAGERIAMPVTEIVRSGPFHVSLDYIGVFDATTGARKMVVTTSGNGADTFSEPAVVDGVLYATEFQTLYAFDATGNTDCSSTPPEGWPGSHEPSQYCTPMWSADAGTVLTGLAVANGDVYVTSTNGTVSTFAANGCGASTCAPLWSASAGASDLSAPAVTGHSVFVGSADGHLYVLPASGCGLPTCVPTWSANPRGTVTTPSVAGEVVFTASSNRHVQAFDATGCGHTKCAALWNVNVGAPVQTQLAISNGRVFATDTAGTLHAYAKP
jgi:hypothetical protein